jgi:cation diffusion facilitator CzcD-associated flavoprotein CzcO
MTTGEFARDARVAVIGAGPSGIAAAKALLDEGYRNIVVFDRGRDVGGNWVFDDAAGHSSVFESTHIISSRRYSQYDDYPMPESYPDYPAHRLLAEYFQGYANHFGLYPFIRFGTTVQQCVPGTEGGWTLRVADDSGSREEVADVLVVANGHHWDPRWPEYPGELTCRYLHSHQFKRAEPFRNQRVLVIGGGNSACDVAVEASRVAAGVDISWRRGYWIVPKFLFGVPGDHIHHAVARWLGFVPSKIRFRGLEALLRLLNGANTRYGLPDPDHGLAETHPTLNSELLYFIRHGEIRPRPDVESWSGSRDSGSRTRSSLPM